MSTLFFSEYAEGSSNNKYLEIFNPTQAAISLADYAFPNASNGADVEGAHDYWNTFSDGASIAAGGTYLITHPDADASIVELADQTHRFLSNGDDGYALVRGSETDYVVLDRLGDFGADPGSGWDVAGVSNGTQNHTLVRKSTHVQGNSDWTAARGTTTNDSEWVVLAQDAFLEGVAEATPGRHGLSTLFFSEYAEGSSNNKYLEIFNPTQAAISLADYAFPNASNGADVEGAHDYWNTFSDGASIAAGGTYLITHPDADASIVELADQTHRFLSNGDDGYALVRGSESDYVVLDRLGDFGADPGAGWDVAGVTNGTQNHTLERKATVFTGNADWDASRGTTADDSEWVVLINDAFLTADADPAASPGSFESTAATPVVIPAAASEDDAAPEVTENTLISLIQGSADTSPHLDEVHRIEGVVTAIHSEMDGFYVQEETSDSDGNAATSEGLFVYDRNDLFSGAVGDLVQVTGTVAEYTGSSANFTSDSSEVQNSLTQLTSITTVTVLSSGADLPPLTNLTLPAADMAAFEALEGMRVSVDAVDQPLVVTNNYTVGRYSQVGLSGVGRLFQYTEQNAPDVDGYTAYLSELERGVIWLDDASTENNPATSIHARGGQPLSAANTLRTGDTINSISGVLDQRNEGYRVQTTEPANFQASNGRPSPIVDDQASLTLAGFNLLNFWNGDGAGGGFPTERGARDIETYNQQLSKLVPAIVGLNADVIALQELENDGYEELSAIDSLVDALNAVSDSSVYAYVTVPDALLNGGIGRSELVAADLISAGGLAHEIPSHNSVTTELEFRSLINAFARSRGESANFEAVTPFDSNFVNGISATVGEISFSWNVSGHGADADAGTGPHATRDGSGLSFSDTEFQSMLSLGILGTDAIANGFIYRTDAVRLAPDTGVAVLDLGYTRVGDDPATDEANRPVIAVSFEEISSGEVFTAVSAHFKSKGSIAQGDGNEDLGDGAGNNNGQRTREAQAVVDWLETDPTNSNDTDVIVLGDLNAYSMEDPLMAFRNAGYTNLVGTDDYSYQFRGQFGSLDHALVSDSMLFPITSASPWHINSDEPVALTTGNYQYAQNPENYYAADAFASSDHDPIVVGLDFDRADTFRINPYLQNPSNEGTSITWFTHRDGLASISLTGPGITGERLIESSVTEEPLLSYTSAERRQTISGLDESWLISGGNFKHVVDLDGLESGATYNYTVTLEGGETFQSSFETAPDSDDWSHIRFIAMADSETEPKGRVDARDWQPSPLQEGSLDRPSMDDSQWAEIIGTRSGSLRYALNQRDGYQANLDIVNEREPDFLVMPGDLVQGGGYQPGWDEFFRHNAGEFSSGLSSYPLLPALGNWENYGALNGGYGEDEDGRFGPMFGRQKYHAYFDAPENGTSEHQDNYYRVDYGPVTILTLDSSNGEPDDSRSNYGGEGQPEQATGLEMTDVGTDTQANYTREQYEGYGGTDLSDFNPGSIQWNWVEDQLRDARDQGQIIFAQFHHAPYSSGVHGFPMNHDQSSGQAGTPLRQYSEMFEEYGVAAVFSGHSEMFERSFVDGDGDGHGVNFYDVGVAGDGLRGQHRTVSRDFDSPLFGYNSEFSQWTADQNEPELWQLVDGVPQLMDGGKHYGHLEVNIEPVDDILGVKAKVELSPVYSFPILDSNYELIETERRVYGDQLQMWIAEDGSVANSLDGFYPDPLRGTAGNDDTLTDALDFGSSDVLFMGSGDDVADAAIVSGRENTVFTGSGDDVVYASHRDVVIGGSGNDSAYLIEDGDNRVAGNKGFDVFHVGTSGNRVLGGADDDVINVLDGAGINYLRGGDGYDAFWLVSAAGDRPAEAQMVMDFNPDEDVVGLAGVSYESLAFEQVGSDTRLSVNGFAVGVFRDLDPSTLSDISNFAGLLI